MAGYGSTVWQGFGNLCYWHRSLKPLGALNCNYSNKLWIKSNFWCSGCSVVEECVSFGISFGMSARCKQDLFLLETSCSGVSRSAFAIFYFFFFWFKLIPWMKIVLMNWNYDLNPVPAIFSSIPVLSSWPAFLTKVENYEWLWDHPRLGQRLEVFSRPFFQSR